MYIRNIFIVLISLFLICTCAACGNGDDQVPQSDSLSVTESNSQLTNIETTVDQSVDTSDGVVTAQDQPGECDHASVTDKGVCSKCNVEIFTEGLQFESYRENYSVVGYSGNSKVVIVPEKYNGLNVVYIEDDAFQNNTNIEEVLLPNSVNQIDSDAFCGCTSLKKINIPENVSKIYSNTFEGCAELVSIIIPKKVDYLGREAFLDCVKLTLITFESEYCQIQEDVFYNTGYYNDKSNWDNGVLYIGKHLFSADKALSGVCAIKEGTISIADEAFYKCEQITEILIPDSVVRVGSHAFKGCKFKSIVIPDSVTEIGSGAFYGCRMLKSIKFSSNIDKSFYRNVNDYLFEDTGFCYNADLYENGALYLEQHMIRVDYKYSGVFEVKNGTKSIGSETFYNCSGITEVIIPNSVIYIGGDWFEKCSEVPKITFNGTLSEWADIEKEYNWNLDRVFTVHCSDGDVKVELPPPAVAEPN